ncbi:terminal uridylyltransferase Tailor [Anastrepha ludens]|uniref:terminal uridylyltransferase Tailor n=1 Tax=Anastrepha ludens TaxID=28586 RepID=UPI0023AEF63F|nr:terminal uridylyltransferase Tailor [Anastrepha ludens]
MAELPTQDYLHPLTLESQLFINSLETYSGVYNQIDPNLCNSLKNVVLGIEKFLDQNPVLIVSTHKTKFVQLTQLSTIQNIYHCTFCKKDLGKSADKAAIHLAERHRMNTTKEVITERRLGEKARSEPKLIRLPKKAKAIVRTDFATFFANQLQVAEKLKQIPEYSVIEDSLSNILKKLFPDKTIKLYKFGSRITGIGSRNSDLDIYVDIGGRFNCFEQSASPETLNIFDQVHEIVKKNAIDWRLNRPIRGARVPILRMTSTKTNIECDVGFSNGISYCNTRLLEYIFLQQPIARRLCIFMKKWLERTRLNKHITTYCMSLMVIYFLQVKNVLPSIELLQKNMLTNVLIGPWIGNFTEISLAELNMQVLNVTPQYCKQHIKEFCEFYANFNYKLYVVCPYFGRKDIEIKNFEALLPERYTNFVLKSETKNCGIQLNTPMVVQDPLQMNHNVAERCSMTDFKEWRDYLKQSVDILSELK